MKLCINSIQFWLHNNKQAGLKQVRRQLTLCSPTCRALKMTTGVRGERVALLSRSCSSLFCRPRKSVGGLRVCVPQYWTELKASGKRDSFLKRSNRSRSTDSDDLSKTRHRLPDSITRIDCRYSISICLSISASDATPLSQYCASL